MKPRLEPPDLEFLELGAAGPFDEKDLASSPLSRLGTGRTLDALGSMLERGVLEREGGGFAVSGAVRGHLLDHAVPLHTRILRLLEISPLEIPRIKACLREDGIEAALRALQEEGAAYTYPLLRDGVPVPVYQASEHNTEGYASEISGIMNDVTRLGADPALTKPILERLRRLSRRLESGPPGRGSGRV